MELWMIAGVLFAIAAILFGYSIIKKEEKDIAYKELEEFSLSVTRNVHELSERVVSLENEHNLSPTAVHRPSKVTKLTEDNIITLFKKGVSVEKISAQLDISNSSVQHVVDNYISEGINT